VTYDLDLLRRHLLNIHQIDSAIALDDQTAVEEHWDAHNTHPAANRWYHSHADEIPPTICPDPRPDHHEQPSTERNDPFLTPAEIARDLRVSKMTIYRLIQEQELTAVRVGRGYRVRTSAYHRFLEGNQK
jgi:excisionase family DNA binding protein